MVPKIIIANNDNPAMYADHGVFVPDFVSQIGRISARALWFAEAGDILVLPQMLSTALLDYAARLQKRSRDSVTVIGFDIRAVGANARAAAFAGVPVTRTIVLVALLSGALAGLAGAIEVAGRTSYVTLDMSPGYGYSGIVIAMLAGLHPLGVLAAAVFVAGVLVGADTMSRAIGVPTYIADVIVAASLIAVLVILLTRMRR